MSQLFTKHKSLLRIVALVLSVVSGVGILALTAFAQNTYVINVDDQVTVHNSFATDPAQVLDEAGVVLGAYDIYTTTSGEGVEEITVQRGMVVCVDDCGKTSLVYSYGETVAQLLQRLKITVGSGEELLADLQEQVYDGMYVQIQRREQAARQYWEKIKGEK